MSSELTHETTTTRIQPTVGGWLLVLCFLLVIFSPATVIYAVFWKALPKIFATGSVHRVILLSVYSATFLGVATWSVWAGLKLWLVQPGADKFARKYLVGYLAANVGYFAFWYVVSRPATSLSLAQMGWYHIVGPIGSTALWYFYLENSARVRETYSTPEF